MTSTVTAAIVNWNSGERLSACVESLMRTGEVSGIVVIDNDSSDGSVTSAVSAVPNLTTILNKTNRGFAAGVNQAFAASTAPFVLALNPDVEVEAGAVARLLQVFEETPEAGAAGGFVNARYLPKRFPTVGSLALENLGLRSPAGTGVVPATTQRVDQPAAAALMIRRAAFDAVGGFDERFYPAWYEDVDFCLRLHRANWHCYFVPAARFRHSGGYSADQLGLERFLTIFYTNQHRFVRKHFGAVPGVVVRAALALGMLARMVVAPSQARAYSQAFLNALGEGVPEGRVRVVRRDPDIPSTGASPHPLPEGEGTASSRRCRVSVNIVTFNSAADIGACIESLRAQMFSDCQIHALDNGSTDGSAEILKGLGVPVIQSPVNTGFCHAHNKLARNNSSGYILFLNPDTILTPTFLEELVRALDSNLRAASASGKLLRMDRRTIDSTGIVMTRNQRHLDRGSDETDTGQYDRAESIFGPSGAAALYRVEALRDAAIDGQYFDEDFFAYREDADLAWRCRLLGWDSLYVPTAVAPHRRRVTPDRRRRLPAAINRHSVKNRFLLRINNITSGLYRRDLWPITKRDLAVIGYVFVREWSSFPALIYIVRHFPRLWRKRRQIQSRVRVSAEEIARWFR